MQCSEKRRREKGLVSLIPPEILGDLQGQSEPFPCKNSRGNSPSCAPTGQPLWECSQRHSCLLPWLHCMGLFTVPQLHQSSRGPQSPNVMVYTQAGGTWTYSHAKIRTKMQEKKSKKKLLWSSSFTEVFTQSTNKYLETRAPSMPSVIIVKTGLQALQSLFREDRQWK